MRRCPHDDDVLSLACRERRHRHKLGPKDAACNASAATAQLVNPANCSARRTFEFCLGEAMVHVFQTAMAGNFTLSTTVISTPKHRYDQAGLLVWLSPDCWLKTAVEFEPDQPSRLGAVVTNYGWSDWSTQDVAPDYGAAWFRIVRTQSDYEIYAATADPARDLPETWTQIRITHLHESAGSIHAGLYACSPQGAGFEATFTWLEVEET